MGHVRMAGVEKKALINMHTHMHARTHVIFKITN